MSQKPGLNRRELLGLGIALPLGAVAPGVVDAAESCGATPRQTSGPFFPAYEQVDKDVDLTRVTGHEDRAEGQIIRVRGRVLDADCRPVEGALVDLWQADSHGRYSHPADPNPAPRDPNFQGWGQAVTDADGRYSFTTIKPAAYPLAFLGGKPDEQAGYRTPHIHFRVSKRGFKELTTQLYFAGEALNDSDIVLKDVPVAERPKVVLAPLPSSDGEDPIFVFEMTLARA